MNPLNLSNVTLSEEKRKRLGGEEPKVSPTIEKVIFNLAVAHPLWLFVAGDSYGFIIENFDVMHDGEKLGSISRRWHGRDHVITVSNDRIADQRERSSFYRTKDPAKAILMVKKMFSRASVSERIDKAEELANDVLKDQQYAKEREANNRRHLINVTASEFAATEVGKKAYREWLIGASRTRVLTAMDELDEIEADANSIAEIRDQVHNGNATLIIQDGSNYILKCGEDKSIVGLTELPARCSNVGMLKLVDVKHCINRIGCRVDENVFVVMNQEELTNDDDEE